MKRIVIVKGIGTSKDFNAQMAAALAKAAAKKGGK